jgi:hypothetical protein
MNLQRYMAIAAVSPVMKGPYADRRRARRNNPPVESSKRKIMIGRNHWEPMTGPMPRLLIRTSQQSGHFGIAAARTVVMTGNPTALELGPMVDGLSTLLLTENSWVSVGDNPRQVALVTKLASQPTAQ